MEYVAIDKESLNSLNQRINNLLQQVNAHIPTEKSNLETEWIENKELACRLGISPRTLQNYRERGILGFSVIERKIFYKTSDVQALIDSRFVHAKHK